MSLYQAVFQTRAFYLKLQLGTPGVLNIQPGPGFNPGARGADHPLSVPCLQQDFRLKNTDHMRPDVVLLLRGSERAFLRQLVCSSPAALFRWGVLRATIRIIAIFRALARNRSQTGMPPTAIRSPVCLGQNAGQFAG